MGWVPPSSIGQIKDRIRVKQRKVLLGWVLAKSFILLIMAGLNAWFAIYSLNRNCERKEFIDPLKDTICMLGFPSLLSMIVSLIFVPLFIIVWMQPFGHIIWLKILRLRVGLQLKRIKRTKIYRETIGLIV